MKKQLLSLSLAMALFPAINADAAASLTEVWNVMSGDFNANWDPTAPDWNSADAVKSETCARFATGKDGKMYTINMKTMSITEITADGFKDKYKLPQLEGDDYYGTAISMDQAGNFLIGHRFSQAPYSSTQWSIYNPENGKIKHFDLGVPEDYTVTIDGKEHTGIGRIDIVGRVLGDLTRDAVFFIGPQSTFAQTVRMVFVMGDGSLDNDPMVYEEKSPGVYLGTPEKHNIAQPKYATLSETRTYPTADGFILSSCEGGKWDTYPTFTNGVSDGKVSSLLKPYAKAKTNGFDTFIIDGRRYFVRNYLSQETTETNFFTMNIAIFNENGLIVAEWENTRYNPSDGYSTITAEPLEDGTANIYVYNSASNTSVPGYASASAAMLKFSPESKDEAIGSQKNPIKITSPQELVDMRKYFFDGDIYIELENDIDMTGVNYIAPIGESERNKIIHFNGKNHVIKNLTVTSVCNGSLLGYFTGTVENLGMENVYIEVKWFCVGAIAGYAQDATISNCYVTGTIIGAAAGGLVGCNTGNLTISNCYSKADITDQTETGFAGGLVGRAEGYIMADHCYTSGSIKGTQASGIASFNTAPAIFLENVIAWNPSVTSYMADSAAPLCAMGTPVNDKVYIWEGMKVNDVPVENGTPTATLIEIATGWEAYNNILVGGMPVLKWQTASGRVEDVVVDDNCNAAPEYYNLQGVRVETPSPGLYIVKRGNKVTKEIIR